MKKRNVCISKLFYQIFFKHLSYFCINKILYPKLLFKVLFILKYLSVFPDCQHNSSLRKHCACEYSNDVPVKTISDVYQALCLCGFISFRFF